MNILVIDLWLPTPDRDSASMRMVNLLAVLQELGGEITFGADDLAARPSGLAGLQARGIRVLAAPIAGHLALEGAKYDVVILSRVPVALKYISIVKAAAPRARVIFDTTDLHHVRAFRAAKLTGNARALCSAVETKRDELAMMRASDVTLVVSPVEQQSLQRECPGARVHVVSNIHAAHGSAAGFAKRAGIVFIGAFAHHPNADAMQYFFDEIYALLRSQLDAPHAIGSQPPEWLRAKTDARVIVTGHVRNLSSYLNRCRLTIAPLRYGAGVKGKVLESMSYGVPVVGTSIAAEGIPAQDRRDMLIADAPARFRDAVIDLYSNQPLWNQLSANGLTLIQKYYTASSARIALIRVFEELSLATGAQA